MYKLTIIKYEKNENYEQELVKWKENHKYGTFSPTDDYDKPQREKEIRTLEVVLTEEEYKKIKFDTLTTFE